MSRPTHHSFVLPPVQRLKLLLSYDKRILCDGTLINSKIYEGNRAGSDQGIYVHHAVLLVFIRIYFHHENYIWRASLSHFLCHWTYLTAAIVPTILANVMDSHLTVESTSSSMPKGRWTSRDPSSILQAERIVPSTAVLGSLKISRAMASNACSQSVNSTKEEPFAVQGSPSLLRRLSVTSS